MASVVEICNLALQKAGANPITSLTDDSEEARACNRFYQPTLRAELRRHAWNFAIKRQSVAEDTDAPIGDDFDNQYTLPADCVRILPDNTVTDWTIEGRKILTNDDEVILRYIWEVDDPNIFDPLFIEALACRLAMQLCEKLTESTSKRQLAAQEYKEAISEAKRINAFESISQEAPEDGWIAARR